MKRIAFLVAGVLMLYGCGAIKAPTANFAELTDAERSDEISKDVKTAIDKDWGAAMALCDTYMSAVRDQYYGSGRSEITIASIGIIAGSVVVPALAAKAATAKSVIAAWGGVSGAANAAQFTFQQKGLSASRLGSSYSEVRNEIKLAVSHYSSATKNSQRLAALYDLHVACRYPVLPATDSIVAPNGPASSPG
ncbi:hypothetical protein [Sphaerotilus sp.]|uniref:hypothetical protein n=1 Tax=Sphaerotilus sp. TaxID=2093942 RepID=UPI0025E5FCAC|nr:hypothetical protein [Sphaerotilus sp.]